MKADRKLMYAKGMVICGLGIEIVTMLMAVLLSLIDGFVGLATFQATSVTLLFTCVLAATVCYAFYILLTQPDDVSPNEERGKVFRERIRGAVVYQNMENILDPVTIIYAQDQVPLKVQCTPSRMPSRIEVLDNSLEELFLQAREE